MPLTEDADGETTYVSVADLAQEFYPSDFLASSQVYKERLAAAKFRCIEVIRFSETPLYGKGLCAQLESVGTTVYEVADFINGVDSKRIKRLRRQRRREKLRGLEPGEWRLRSPQPRSKRRSALFSATDIPSGYFEDHFGFSLSTSELERFVDIMRLLLIQEALEQMIEAHELERVGDIWLMKVSALDEHTKRAHRRRNVKRDDRSFYGRPNRDRGSSAA